MERTGFTAWPSWKGERSITWEKNKRTNSYQCKIYSSSYSTFLRVQYQAPHCAVITRSQSVRHTVSACFKCLPEWAMLHVNSHREKRHFIKQAVIRHLMPLAVVSVFCCVTGKTDTTHPANEVGTQCGSVTIWCALRHPSPQQYPVAAFTKLRPGIATEHQWPHFSCCHTVQHKQQMLPTVFSDIDELLLSPFTPYSFMDNTSVGVLDASEYFGIFSTSVRSDRYLHLDTCGLVPLTGLKNLSLV